MSAIDRKTLSDLGTICTKRYRGKTSQIRVLPPLFGGYRVHDLRFTEQDSHLNLFQLYNILFDEPSKDAGSLLYILPLLFRLSLGYVHAVSDNWRSL